jgi:hypothetical protein
VQGRIPAHLGGKDTLCTSDMFESMSPELGRCWSWLPPEPDVPAVETITKVGPSQDGERCDGKDLVDQTPEVC